MNSTKWSRVFALTAIMILFVSSAPFSFAFDEGMFMTDKISTLPLKKLGMKIPASDIYNPAGGGISDAIIRLSIGCTAEFVSPEGLILTNHHCGFDALVTASTPDKDLVESGFNSGGRSGEIRAMNGKDPYTVQMTQREEDVTARVKAGTENLSGAELNAAWQRNATAVQESEQAKAPKGSKVSVQNLNNGLFFYLFQTAELSDIRVVYAPPRNIGVYGGDPDNFEWTRQTGDFSVLRAYAAPDGSPADYSPDNVPYKPKRFLTMNIGGLKDNDFVWVMGFPGGTTRYRESWSVEYARDANFPFLVKWLTALSDSLRKIGSTDDAKRIEFQDEIANYDNSRKAYDGGAKRLRQAEAVQKRQAEEARLTTWIAASPDRQKKYGTVLGDLRSLSEKTNGAQIRDSLMRRFPDPTGATPVFNQIVAAMAATQPGSKQLDDAARAKKLQAITAAYVDRDATHELDMLKFFLKAMDELPAGQKFQPAEDLFGSLKGKARRDAEAKFADTIANGEYTSAERTAGLYGPRTMEFIKEREDILKFARGVVDERTALAERSQVFGSQIDHLRLLYQQAMAEMKGTTPYPDANFTQRFSYGNVKGYQSREAEYRTPFTTMKGMLEKDTGINPFDMPQKLKDLQASKDFGRYGSGDSVGVNFLSSTDIIGGNSGSPILNGNGEQVGLCFDGNFEGLGNDFYYDPNVNRTISVDIRFVLFVIDKFSGATYLSNEFRTVGGPKTKG